MVGGCVPHRYSRPIRRISCSDRAAERRVKELYITCCDVQTKRLIFFNIRSLRTVKMWYTFHKFHNRPCRWLEEPV